MRMKVELGGLNTLLGELRKAGDGAERAVLEVITDIVTDTHAFAVAGIQGGPKSGRTYRRGTVTHTASAPGQYPASDTGNLVGRIGMELPAPGRLSGAVGTSVVYGPMLEFGTSRMAARPWLMPSFERARLNVENELRIRMEAKL